MAQVRRQGLPDTVRPLVRWVTAHPARMLAALVVAALALGSVVGGTLVASGDSFHIERADAMGAQDATADETPDETGAVSTDDASDAGADGDAAETASEQAAHAAAIVVDVDGAVAQPGVVTLANGARVADAIVAAGGLTSEADTTSLNQAAILSDGEKVYVPREGETASAAASPSSSKTGIGSDSSSGLININTATVEDLDTLPGVGPATAQAIVEEREANGAFTSPEDIMRVSGIGEKKYENLADLICV